MVHNALQTIQERIRYLWENTNFGEHLEDMFEK